MSYFAAGGSNLHVFVYALRFPELIYVSAGATLTTVVVPLYSSLMAKNGRGRADVFLQNILNISGLLLIVLVAAGVLLAPVIPVLTGFRDTPAEYGYAVFYLRALMPVMFFFGISSVFQGMLQSNGRFTAAACVTLPTSLAIFIYIFLFGERFGVTGLMFATAIGLSLQAVFLVPSVIKTGFRHRFVFDYKDEGVATAARMTPPVLAGVSAYQLNTFFNATLATYFGATAMLRINNAQQFVFILTLSFVYSLTAVYFPKLTRLWAAGDTDGYIQCLAESTATALFFLIPLAVGFMTLRYEIFDLIARWGRFGAEDTRLTGDFTGLYALGVIAMGLKEIFDRGFYAQKNAKTSAAVGFMIMGVNVAFSLVFMRFIGAYALPLSYAVSCTAGVCALAFKMRKKCGGMPGRFLSDNLKCAAAALIMGAAVVMVSMLLKRAFIMEDLLSRIVRLMVPVSIGATVYFAAAYLLRVPYCVKAAGNIMMKWRKKAADG